MPDQPPAKRSVPPLASPVADRPDAVLPYAELHCQTNFSFLEAASHPDELAQQAALLGYRALAITDRNSLAGVVRAHGAAKQLELKLLIGAEIILTDAPPVVLLATDRAAYGRLSRLLTLGRRRTIKGECELSLTDLAEYAAGLLALVQLPTTAALHHLISYRDIFADRCYLLAELHHGPDDPGMLQAWKNLSRQGHVPLVAANDVHYHIPARRALQDVLTAIRHGCTVADAGALLEANAERHLKSPQEMARLFAEAPEAFRRTVEIADHCTFSLDELRYEYPEELCPAGLTPSEYLAQLTWQGAAGRCPEGIPQKVHDLLTHELTLIEELRYEAYFLTVWDLVRFARSRGILCQGRGSAANSVVCYCLEVTSVDLDHLDVLFERFISRERNEAPDIDIDFEHERREEVLQYLYNKYGRERAGLAAEVITYRLRSAVRDVGKALGLSLVQVDKLAKQVDLRDPAPTLEEPVRDVGLDPRSPVVRQLIELGRELHGFPRHLSQHVGGMVMTRGPLCELVPIENAAMPDRTVIQWDKDDLDELGILKVDCLALGMLTAIRKCFSLVERHYGKQLTLANVPGDDPAVYEMISRADTLGVFQIESRAQMSMLPRLKPRCFYDLVIEVAIVRPGPIQGDMVHPYLRRRAGEEAVEYPHEDIREVLGKTLGVPLFQEQAMRLAVVAAGFTPGEADQLRRAMAGWRRPGLIEQFRLKLLAGMRNRGLSEEYAERVFQQIRGFGEYGFPESHAASFALLVYVSAWLKHYYPDAFCAALLNSQPMGFYAPAQLVRDARQHGVEVLPVDINHSEYESALVVGSHPVRRDEFSTAPSHFALRLGFDLVSGLPKESAASISVVRCSTLFHSLEDFARRTGFGRPMLVRLAHADVFGSLGLDRRTALWQATAHDKKQAVLPLLADLDDTAEEVAVVLPELGEYQEVLADYRTVGLSLRSHPLSFWRTMLTGARVVAACELATLPVGQFLRVAGLVLVRQRPGTASGITFVTLEDETGVANLIVRPAIWHQYRDVARGSVAMIAHGHLERQGLVIHILVSKLEDLKVITQNLPSQSRDFR
jgi:error-prone DNA polymerase